MKNKSDLSSGRLALDEILQAELEILASSGLHRRLCRIDEVGNGRAFINGRELIAFGSNNYLGLAGHPELKKAAAHALEWGVGATGSRLTTGNFALHELLEQDIARFKHAEAAIIFSSGYAANVGVIPALAEKQDLILSDSLNHASLIDGCRLSRAEVRIYNHCDTDHVRNLLSDRSSFRRCLVTTDSVFSMDGDIAPLNRLVEICDGNDAWLLVDDAHGTGVYGERGSGLVEHCGLVGRVHIQMGTLSKAVGAAGAFVAGSETLIDFLRNKARSFIFSTASSPADVAAARKSLELIGAEPERRDVLRKNIKVMRDGLAELGLTVLPGDSPIIPLIIGDADEAVAVSSNLEASGIWIPAIRPPTIPVGTSRLRITVTAAHSEDDILTALAVINNTVQKQLTARTP